MSTITPADAAPRLSCPLVADPAKFDHDRLGHLLEDRLLMVPKFQRSFAWDDSNVQEYLDDLRRAREAKREYFMGTVVLAEAQDIAPRQLIVDGQQRIATTALLLVAIRNRLREVNKVRDAQAVADRFLKRYELSVGEEVTRLVLGPNDLPSYDALIEGEALDESSPLVKAYRICKGHVDELCPTGAKAKELNALVLQLSNQVQVLLAIASGIPEAYVIFETLNDRGADLTTADLLKNYVFSQANAESIGFVEASWTAIAAAFDKPEELVKFIRYEFASVHGRTTNRQLYRALQDAIGTGPSAVKKYLVRLKKALEIFLSLRDPDHQLWASTNTDVRDSLLAYRRFGFESSMPLLLAVFREWDREKAAKAVNLVAAWSVRAVIAGTLGGGTSEEAFCTAAKAVADGVATTQPQLRAIVGDIVPKDAEFKQAFLSYGPVATTRAKYLLAMLEKQHCRSNGHASPPDWSTKGVTIEHVFPASSARSHFATDREHEDFLALRDNLWNYALLERGLNREAENRPFTDKRAIYQRSGFKMTSDLGQRTDWSLADAAAYANSLATLAVSAWRR